MVRTPKATAEGGPCSPEFSGKTEPTGRVGVAGAASIARAEIRREGRESTDCVEKVDRSVGAVIDAK